MHGHGPQVAGPVRRPRPGWAHRPAPLRAAAADQRAGTGSGLRAGLPAARRHRGAADAGGGGRAGEQFPLERTQTTIGRTPDCDIFLDDVTVSRRHAIVAKGAATFTLQDLGSLNGTFLNRHRIEQAELESGDEVQIGKYRLIFLGA